MAQTIKLKRSATEGAVPTTGSLELGEVAINTYDGKMYIKKDDGTESVVEVGDTSEYLPLAGGTLTGNLLANHASATPIQITRSSGTNINIKYSSASGTTYVGQGASAGTLRVGTNADLIGTGNEVWHYGNLPTSSVANWNTAYSWGDHASAGYLPSSSYTNVFKSGSEIAGSQDLNNYRTTGYYSQDSNADATSGSNYPVSLAGLLEVITGDQGNGLQTEQRYSRYNTNDKYVRHYYNGNWTAWAQQWTSASDGSGSGLDADLLDGQQGSYYAPKSAPDFTGEVFTDASQNAWAFRATTGATSNSSGLWFTGTTARLLLRDSSGVIKTSISANGTNSENIINGNTIWHAGNDGSGSGLDADLLDGQQGSAYLRSNVSATNSVDLRAPIFYDSGNTGNYLDSPSSSIFRLNGSTAVNLAVGGTTKLTATTTGIGIGTSSPMARLDVESGAGNVGFNYGTSSSPERGNLWYDTDGTGWKFNIGKVQSGSFTSQVTIQDNGNVGIGTSSPSEDLDVSGTARANAFYVDGGSNRYLYITSSDGLGECELRLGDAADTDAGAISYDNATNSMQFRANAAERLRIDSSGNLLVGTTDSNVSNNNGSGTGFNFLASGQQKIATDGNLSLILNRLNGDGGIVEFKKDGTAVGSIGSAFGNRLFVGNGDTAVRFAGDLDTIVPWNASTNALRDAAIDLGEATGRFKDLYLSGSARASSFVDAGNSNNYLDSPTSSVFRLNGSSGFVLSANGSTIVTGNSGGIDVTGTATADVLESTGGSYSAGVDTVSNAGLVLAQDQPIYSLSASGQYLRYLIRHSSSNDIAIGQSGTGLIGNIDLYTGTSGTVRFYTAGLQAQVTSTGSVDAKSFRDIDNTAFYVDPASTSVLNNLQLNGVLNTGTNVNLTLRRNGSNVLNAVSGATYLYPGDSSTVALTLQSGRAIAPILSIGQVNNYVDVIDSSRNLTNIGNITSTADNSFLTMGVAGAGSAVGGRYLSIEGNTDTGGEGSGRIFFAEHNSTTASMDNYGMSLGYRGGATTVEGASGNTWDGLGQIGNGEWGMWGHNDSASGSLIMYGDRAASFINFAGNGLDGVGRVRFSDTSPTLQEDGNYLRIQTSSGWTSIGSGNSSWTHFFTDRGGFYFGTRINVNGEIKVYNSNTRLISTGAYAPAFYDSDDTAFYVNPASTSVMNTVYIGGSGGGYISRNPGSQLGSMWIAAGSNGTGGGNTVVLAGGNVPYVMADQGGTSITGDLTPSGTLYLDNPNNSSTNDPNIDSKGELTSGTAYSYHALFKDGNGVIKGRITHNQYGAQFSNLSDYRAKEDYQEVENATSRLMSIPVRNFQWIGSDLRTDGFLAHEIAEVVPEAVVGEKDAVLEDGTPDYQSIDQSKIVPLLVKTIQELEARITALENA
jgi:hypothetical protein